MRYIGLVFSAGHSTTPTATCTSTYTCRRITVLCVRLLVSVFDVEFFEASVSSKYIIVVICVTA